MKIMVELDTANTRETFLLAGFLTQLSLLETGAEPAAPTAERRTGKMPELAAGFDMSKIPPAGAANPPETESQSAAAAPPPPPPSNVVPLKPEIPPPPPSPGAAPAAPEYDTNGMPWDARIHASTKAKTISGAWKNRRGVDEAERLAIEATLPRAPAAAPPPPPPSAVPPPPTPEQMGVTRVGGVAVPPGADLGAAVAALKGTPPVPPVPGAMPTVSPDDEADLEPDVPPLPPAPAAAAPSIDFPTLMIKVSEAMGSGAMTLESVKATIKPLGVETLFELSGRADLIEPVAKALGFA